MKQDETCNDARPDGHGRRHRSAFFVLGALLLLYGAWVVLGNWRHTVDDALISLQYSRSLSLWEGLAYNPGEYVEGFSNPTWVFLAALPLALGIDGLLALKCLGLLSHLLTILLVMLLAEELARPSTLSGRSKVLALFGRDSGH